MSAGRPRRGRDGRLDAHRADRLHRRPRQGRRRRSARSASPKAPRPKPPARQHRGDRRSRRRGDRRHRDGDRRARHVQQRRPAARAEDARRDAGADRAEEGDPLFQRRHAAQRRGQPGGAARRRSTPPSAPTSSIYPIDTRGLQAVVPGGDARQASGRGSALFSGRGVAQQFAQLAVVAGHADVARRRHRRPGVHRLERLRRGLRARAARHVGVLPARLQQHEPGEGRPLPPHPGPRRSATACKVEARAGYYADRDFAHTARDRSRDAAPGAAVRGRVGDRSAGAGDRRLVPAGGGQVLRAGRAGRPGLRGAGRQRARTRSRSTCSAWCATSGTSRSAASARR